MMPGITASSGILPLVAVNPFDLYPGATVVMDFENDLFGYGGTISSASEMLSSTSDISGGRLNLVLDASAPISLNSAVVTAIGFSSSGVSAFFDFEQTNFSSVGWGSCLFAAESANVSYYTYSGWDFIAKESPYTSMWNNASSAPKYAEAEVTVTPTEGMRRKVMISMKSTEISISHNGTLNGPISSTFSPFVSPIYWTLGGYHLDNTQQVDATVRKIIFYPFIAASSLNTYTA